MTKQQDSNHNDDIENDDDRIINLPEIVIIGEMSFRC
jgi:hypothetical protein